jgi:hypothetical protein
MLSLASSWCGLVVYPAVPAVAQASNTQMAANRLVVANTAIFPSTDVLAFIQPPGLGKARASKANPGGAGNAEGNWWTPSSALDTDCNGKPVTARNPLTQECIFEKKTAEIRARQAISEQNGQYKVDKLVALEKRAADAKAQKAQKAAGIRAAQQAKYGTKR